MESRGLVFWGLDVAVGVRVQRFLSELTTYPYPLGFVLVFRPGVQQIVRNPFDLFICTFVGFAVVVGSIIGARFRWAIEPLSF
jgi:hypothetical protein